MPDQTNSGQTESWIPSDRYYVQLALGQVHGVLHRAVEDTSFWFSLPQDQDVALTRADLNAAYQEACGQLGVVQAALNTGKYDEKLAGVGFSGAQLKAKLKGFMGVVLQYATAAKNTVASYLSSMKPALAWSGTIVGSVSAALQKEIDHIPGASAAAEGLKEFIELLQNAAESFARKDTPNRAKTGDN